MDFSKCAHCMEGVEVGDPISTVIAQCGHEVVLHQFKGCTQAFGYHFRQQNAAAECLVCRVASSRLGLPEGHLNL